MNKSESKYFNTAQKMDEALILLLDSKEFEYITVKEICALSNVNRSTFYLHYESINDLLVETVDFINNKFLSYFENVSKVQPADICKTPKEALNFITPEFLKPWLTFVRDNKKIYSTVLKRMDTMRLGEGYMPIITRIIYPIMDKYGIKDSNKSYILNYYLEGLNGIIKEWLRNNCDKEIDEVTRITIGCVHNNGS